MSEYHTPVLLEESVSLLVTNLDGIYADATFGGGGHTALILSRLHDGGRVIAFDRDIDAIENGLKDPRLTLIHNNFRFIENYAAMLLKEIPGLAGNDGTTGSTGNNGTAGNDGTTGNEGNNGNDGTTGNEVNGNRVFDGILADLGVSSHQFDTAERGFSFRFEDAPLDMRMNRDATLTAADVVNTFSEERLGTILSLYGEVENAHTIARLIKAAGTIRTTGDLDAAVAKALPKNAEHKVLAKIYQALRIEVNQEMRSLEKFLEGAAATLKPGGRLAVISYHSLEDRMVKNFMRTGRTDGVQEKDVFGRVQRAFEPVTRKPVVPGESEIAGNTRARSAKLRVAERRAL